MLLSNIPNESTINSFKSSNSIVNKLVSDTLNVIHEAIAICDKNGIILKINSKASRLFGWTDNELVEKKTFDILLTDRYRNNILCQLKTDPSSILDTTHFVYGLKKDGKTFPANIMISSFSKDLLVKDRKAYLIIFSTSFIISQLKSNEPATTKFFDGNSYEFSSKENQFFITPKNKQTHNAIQELSPLSFKEKNEIQFDSHNHDYNENATIEHDLLIDNPSSNHSLSHKSFKKLPHDDDIDENDNNGTSWKTGDNKEMDEEVNQFFREEKMMMYQDEEELEEENPLGCPTPTSHFNSPNSSPKGAQSPSSAPIKRERFEVISTYIPSSIHNFSLYTSPVKSVSPLKREDVIKEHRISLTTYSRYQNEFEEITKLGKGGFGSVYQVRNKLDGQFYAIKKIKLQCDPKNTMECVMNSDFFNAPLPPQTCQNLPLSSSIPPNTSLNSSSLETQSPTEPQTSSTNMYICNPTHNNLNNDTTKNNNEVLDENVSFLTNSTDIDANTPSVNDYSQPTNKNHRLPPQVYHRRYMSATTSLCAATSKFPINTLSAKDIRIIQEVKTFARISNHPNIVRYHGAWIEALEITDSGSDDEDEDDEFSDSDSMNDSFNNDLNCTIEQNYYSSESGNESDDSSIDSGSESDSSDSDSESESESDSDSDSFNDSKEIDEEEDDEEEEDEETETELTQDFDPSQENDDFEIIFENSNHPQDIYIDINDSSSKESINHFQQQHYKKLNETQDISLSNQGLTEPKLTINDKTLNPEKENEESYIISFENNHEKEDEESYIINLENHPDHKSISDIINNPNSTSSFTFNSSMSSVTSQPLDNEKSHTNSKSLKDFTKKILSKKNNNVFINTLKKKNTDNLKEDGKKSKTESINNLSVSHFNKKPVKEGRNLNFNLIKRNFSFRNGNRKRGQIKNSPTLPVIKENCNTSSYFSDNTSSFSHSLTNNPSSSIIPTRDIVDALDLSKKEMTISEIKKSDQDSYFNSQDSGHFSSVFNTALTNSIFTTQKKAKATTTTTKKMTTTPITSLNPKESYPHFVLPKKNRLSKEYDTQYGSKSPKFKDQPQPQHHHHYHSQHSHFHNPHPHPHSKKLYSVLLIQMEFVSGETLQSWLEKRNTSSNPVIDRKIVIKIFKQIVQGLAHIHWNGFIHCDIKPANIFLQEDHHILIGDFGLAKKIVTDSSDLEPEDDDELGAGTYLYASPEQLSEHRCYDNKTDIYSLGILLFELLCPFSTGMERVKTLMDIRQGNFSDEFIKTWPREFLLIKSLLHPDPMERPTALEILDSEILLTNYPFYDTTDLLVALDLHISPEQEYNKNNIELHHRSSSSLKKLNYQNHSPTISSPRSSRNSMISNNNNNNNNNNHSNHDNNIKNNDNPTYNNNNKNNGHYRHSRSTSNSSISVPQKRTSLATTTHCINEGTNTMEVSTANVSTYINSTCCHCQEKDGMISSYQSKTKNCEETIKALKESLFKAKRKIIVSNILCVMVTVFFFILLQIYIFFLK